MDELFVNLWNGVVDFVDEKIISVFKTIGITDIIDILALAFIFFFIYRFAKKRNAFKLVLGVVLFLAVMLLADALNLTALGFVFGNFTQLGVVSILIIFHPEIRSALEKIGGTTFSGLQNINQGHGQKANLGSHYVVEAVSRASQNLSALGMGALIVIEREDSLADYKKMGTALDAIVSDNLLCSIFYNGGALHDGAVVIKDGKVDSAGCVLPLTDRVDISSVLGTRHRAAIGTTERSDAIVVVVSEETGTISISVGGALERNFNYNTLRTRLEDMLIPKQREERKSERPRKNRKGKSTSKKSQKRGSGNEQ